MNQPYFKTLKMNLKALGLGALTSLILAGCSDDPQSVPEFAPEANLSTAVAAENGLATVGCAFNDEKTAVDFKLDCQKKQTSEQLYEQISTVNEYYRINNAVTQEQNLNKTTKLSLIRKSIAVIKFKTYGDIPLIIPSGRKANEVNEIDELRFEFFHTLTVLNSENNVLVEHFSSNPKVRASVADLTADSKRALTEWKAALEHYSGSKTLTTDEAEELAKMDKVIQSVEADSHDVK